MVETNRPLSPDTETEIRNAVERGIGGETVHESFDTNIDGVSVEIESNAYTYNNGHSEIETNVAVIITTPSRFTPESMIGVPKIIDEMGGDIEDLSADIGGLVNGAREYNTECVLELTSADLSGENVTNPTAIYNQVFLSNVQLAGE